MKIQEYVKNLLGKQGIWEYHPQHMYYKEEKNT